MEIKILGNQTKTSEVNLTKIVQEKKDIEDRILGSKDRVEEVDTSVKKKGLIVFKKSRKNIQEIWDTENTTFTNDKNRRRRRNPSQRQRKHFQQNYIRKIL